jgi:hypothetical protein
MLGRPAYAGPSLRAYDNYDLTSSTTKTIQNVELEDCATACQSDNQCQAFSYNKWDRQCSFKQAAGSLRFDPRSVSGIAANLAMPTLSNEPITLQCITGKGVRNEGYRRTPNATFEQCKMECQIEKACSAFTYSDTLEECKLLETVNQVIDETVVLGLKLQSLNSSEPEDGSCVAYARDLTEKERYEAARGDFGKLKDYLASCVVCSNAAEARDRIALLENAFDEQLYEAARGDIVKLREYLTSCKTCSHANQVREGIAWLEQQERGDSAQPDNQSSPPAFGMSAAAVSKACSDLANDKGLHGQERKNFRTECKSKGGKME